MPDVNNPPSVIFGWSAFSSSTSQFAHTLQPRRNEASGLAIQTRKCAGNRSVQEVSQPCTITMGERDMSFVEKHTVVHGNFVGVSTRGAENIGKNEAGMDRGDEYPGVLGSQVFVDLGLGQLGADVRR